MSFGNLQKQLLAFLTQASTSAAPAEKTRIKTEALSAFSAQKTTTPLWSRAFFSRYSTATVSAVLGLFVIGGGLLMSLQGRTTAGEIRPQYGPVEIQRGGETLLVTEQTDLRKGDIVRVGNRAAAELIFPDRFTSLAHDRTEVKILAQDALFLSSGKLKSDVQQSGEILTERGRVRLQPGADFDLQVSDSGEAHILLRKNRLSVVDLFDRETVLREGEELRLRTDTALTDQDMPRDLELSTTQLLAIDAKLVIARTKLLSGIENFVRQKDTVGWEDVSSAEETFRSIAQVLNASRNLTIIKRTNSDLIKNKEIFAMVSQKTKNAQLLAEIQALETLFRLTKEKQDWFAFSLAETGIQSYDRFVLLDRAFQLTTAQERRLGEVLKQEYVLSFYRKIMNPPLKMDQVLALDAALQTLPKTEITREFLFRVKALLAPDLAEILAEKMAVEFAL